MNVIIEKAKIIYEAFKKILTRLGIHLYKYNYSPDWGYTLHYKCIICGKEKIKKCCD